MRSRPVSTSDTGRSRACCQDVMRSAASPAITPTAGPRVTRSRSVGVGGARRRRPSHPPHRLPTWPRRREGQPEPLCRMLISTRVRVASSRCSTVSSTTGKPRRGCTAAAAAATGHWTRPCVSRTMVNISPEWKPPNRTSHRSGRQHVGCAAGTLMTSPPRNRSRTAATSRGDSSS